MKQKKFKSGEIAPVSGQYELLNKNGVSLSREFTVAKREPFPPTPKPDMYFGLADPTKHKK